MSLQAEHLLLIPPQSPTGSYHSSDVLVFTCIGVAIPLVLDWVINDTVIAEYWFRSTHNFPRSIDVNYVGGNVTVIINHAEELPTIDRPHNITSTLTATAIDLEDNPIRCESQNFRSATYNIRIRSKIIKIYQICHWNLPLIVIFLFSVSASWSSPSFILLIRRLQ